MLRSRLYKVSWVPMYLLFLAALMGLAGAIAPEGFWTVSKIPDLGRTPESIVFVDEKTGWISGFFPGVLKTEDGGITWTKLESNLGTQRISTLWFSSKQTGWAIASELSPNGQESHTTILATMDGGRTWSEQTRLQPGVCPMVDIWFLDDSHGWAAGDCNSHAVILTTSDAGRKWVRQYESPDASGELRRVRFANLSRGWAVGPRKILHTNDGGNTWNSQYDRRSGIWLNDLAFVNAEDVWAAGGWGFLLRTRNHGRTWTHVSLPGTTADFVWRIKFADSKHGWLCGAKGEIFGTTDGGETWHRQAAPVDSMLSDIAVTRSQVFVTAGPSEVLVSRRP